ncbi:hypothetical protein SCALM49S_02934 [Streptomyces californicus]
MELAPPGRAARAGLAATAANMGGLGCGPLLAGVLAEYAPWPLRLPFIAHLTLIALAAALTWFLPRPSPAPGCVLALALAVGLYLARRPPAPR